MNDSKKPQPRPSRLGRGLSSLMTAPVAVQPPASEAAAPAAEAPSPAAPAPSDASPQTPPPQADAAATPEGLRYIHVGEIAPNRHQPRQQFDPVLLQTLAASIKSDGLMQPVILRQAAGREDGKRYELIAGERRWRAAQLAGLEQIPALLRDVDDRQSAEWALIENLQREDLNPIDRAEAFHRLASDFNASHDQIAERVGLDRSTVANLIRLLSLAAGVQQLVRDGLLSMGQARALASIGDPAQQEALAKQAVREAMSVRQVESVVKRLVEQGTAPSAAPNGAAAPAAKASHFKDLEQQIGRQLGTRVAIAPGRKKGTGKLTIEFFSIEQFDTLLGKLGVEAE